MDFKHNFTQNKQNLFEPKINRGIFKVVPDTHNLLVPDVPDTQIIHWRGTEVLTRPANIT